MTTETKLTICGLGVYPPSETTLETLQALEECRVVYCDLADENAVAWLKGYCRELRRPKDAAEVAAAARKSGGVGLAVWGHPQFSSALARDVQTLCRKAKTGFRVLGAISPIGSAFARSVSFFGGDYGYQGIQAYDLQTLLRKPEAFCDTLPLVVYAETAGAEDWARLSKILVARYPGGHQARAYPAQAPAERLVPLGGLGQAGLTGGVLLIAPAVAPKAGR
jgi:hypothetical protein